MRPAYAAVQQNFSSIYNHIRLIGEDMRVIMSRQYASVW